jgi:hypothetical protein
MGKKPGKAIELAKKRRSVAQGTLFETKESRVERVAKAREFLTGIYNDPRHEHYFCCDSELRDLSGLSEPVIRSLRASLGIPQRDERIYQYLVKYHKPSTMYLDEMVLALEGRVEYYCLYHILRKRGVDYPKRSHDRR